MGKLAIFARFRIAKNVLPRQFAINVSPDMDCREKGLAVLSVGMENTQMTKFSAKIV
jgi:hypothetical protein